MTTPESHRWAFKARFRRNAFGWRSQPAIQRIKEAVNEIKAVSRHDPILAAEGAVAFLERVSPALGNVDSSSGAIGTAVNNAIVEFVDIIASAPCDLIIRDKWLERLWEAHQEDQMPYIEILADYWGELCASRELASDWADRLVGITRMALSPDPSLHGFFHGTSACLSALFCAERYEEILDILQVDAIWPYKSWAVKALAVTGRKSEAIRYAESCRGRTTSDFQVDSICEEILLSSGLIDEAYRRYGLRANRRGTFLATFRVMAKKYPHKKPDELLADLVQTTPGEEAKWFAAAKGAGLYEVALDLARRSPCDPKTLARAARDSAVKNPDFAVGAGLLSLHWLAQGYGYNVTSTDVSLAYSHTMNAARSCGIEDQVRDAVQKIIASEPPPAFVGKVLSQQNLLSY